MQNNSNNYRQYGHCPLRVVVLHGGPGAPGNMASVARELSGRWGVLEPFQTQFTIQDQIDELYQVIQDKCELPVILIGHSWGAWLAFLYSAKYSQQVKKCILVCAGPFEEHYAANILDTRLSRMSEEEKEIAHKMLETMQCDHCHKDLTTFEKFGKFMSRADAYERIHEENEVLVYQSELFYKVWGEAVKLRRNGGLLSAGNTIQCPVIAVHGDYDPHPADGVKLPLSEVLSNFSFILLERCGHEPWNERYAREEFYCILFEQILLTLGN